MKKTSLYRHFDKDGNLLYVGISINVFARLASHKSNSKWFEKIRTVTIEYFNSQEEARIEEKRIITEEKPPFNTSENSNKGLLNRNHSFTLYELADYLNISRGVLLREIGLDRFVLKPDKKNPYRWVKWKVDVNMMKPEIKEYIKKLQK